MRPELFRIFDVPFHAYRTLLAVAFLICTLLAVRESAKRNEGFVIPPALGVWALLGALLGAKVWYVIQYAEPRDWWRAVLLWEGGLVFFGGLVGGVVVVWAYLRWVKIPFLPAADIMAPFVALGEGFTRIGCFLNGCCWGVHTSMPWGVRFPKGCAAYFEEARLGAIPPGASHTLPLHPTQLYMAGGLLVTFVALKVVLKRKTRPGTVLVAYLLLYGILRFTVEALRGDSARPLLHLTVSQIVSLFMVLTAIVAFALRRTPQSEPK